MSQREGGMPNGSLIYDPARHGDFFQGLSSGIAAAGVNTEIYQNGIAKPMDGVYRGLRVLDDGSKEGFRLEIVEAPDRSMVIPMTSDGKVILVGIKPPTLETSEKPLTFVGLDSDAREGKTSKEIAQAAMSKISIPRVSDVMVQETGVFNDWKYRSTATSSFVASLPVSELDIYRSVTSSDEQINSIAILSEDQFDELTDDGTLTDLPTIAAVKLAFAARREGEDFANSPFPGTEEELQELLAKLEEPEVIRRSGIVYTSVNTPYDYFLREVSVSGQTFIDNSGDQAQMLLAFQRSGEEMKIIMTNELKAAHGAHGERSLSLPGGAVDDEGHAKKNKFGGLFADEAGAHTAAKELAEETGYHAVADSTVSLAPARHPHVQDMSVRSEAFEGTLDYVGAPYEGEADEKQPEKGLRLEIPVSWLGWLIKHGKIKDVPTIVAILDWARQHGYKVL